jgi:hypothetical protein
VGGIKRARRCIIIYNVTEMCHYLQCYRDHVNVYVHIFFMCVYVLNKFRASPCWLCSLDP